VVDQDLFFKLTDHVATQNTAGMLKLVRHVVRSGYDLQEVLVGLAEHVRNLLVAHSLGGEALEEVAASTRTRYVEEAERFEEPDLLRLLTMAGDAEDDIKQSPQPRLKLETVLLKMAQLRRSADLREVLEKIDRLEQMAEEGELPDAVPGNGGTPTEASSPPETTPESSNATSEESAQASADAAAEPMPDYVSESDVVPTPEEGASSAEQGGTDAPSDDEEQRSPPPASKTEDDDGTTADESEREDEDPTEDQPNPGGGAAPDSDPSVEYNDLFGTPALESDESAPDATGDRPAADDPEATGNGTSQASAVAEAEDRRTAVPNGEGPAVKWPRVVQAVKQEYVSLGALLGEAEPVECTDGTLTVAVPRDLHRDTLRDRKRDLLDHVTATLEPSVEEIRFVVETTAEEMSTEENTSDEPLSPREQLQQLRDTYSALDVLFADFGAEPVW
jgi:DNA polymerase-3 subunit gamma/tau